MSEREYAKIIAKNLRNIMFDAEKSQADVSKDLKISKATVSSWMNGTRIPRMDKIDILCHYFNVSRQDIMEPAQDISDSLPNNLTSIYRSLNKTGQEQLLKYANFLASDPTLTKDTGSNKEEAM